MGDQELLYDVAEGVARLTINRPDKRNSLSWEVVSSLRGRLADAQADPAVRVVVITGSGEKAFCSGADLSTMAGTSGFAAMHDARGELAHLFEDLYALGKPTIARVRGFALAGGFGLALACDLVVAAADATFATPEIDVGLWPFIISVPLLRSMPPKRALELMMTGRRVGAAEADRLGFLTKVVAVPELDAAVDELAATLAAKPPGVMRLGRDSFYSVVDQSAADALRQLHPLLTVGSQMEDAAEGIAAFLEKRPPDWSGR